MGVSTLTEASARLERALSLNSRGRHAAASKGFDAVLAWCAEPAPTTDRRAVGTRDRRALVVRARIGLAVCHFESRGDVESALDLLEAAETAAEHDRALRAVVLGQRGLLLHRTGAMGAASHAMDEAMRLVPADAWRDLAVLHMNRGSLRSDMGRLAEAAEDFAACADYARRIGNPLYSSMAEHNQGWVTYLRGDLPVALRVMDQAAAAAPERHAAVGLVDKAQVLLDAGLVADADETLREAREHLRRYRMVRDLAEVELVRSQALVALRRFDDARQQARSAARRFARMGNVPWELRAQVHELEALAAADARGAVVPAAARRRAAAALAVATRSGSLGREVRLGVEVRASLLAADWYATAGDLEAARGALDAIPAGMRHAPLPLRIQHEAVLARIAYAAGDRAAGLRAVRRGQAALTDHRARLGSVDAVTASAVHGVRLGNIDVEAARRTGRPAPLLDAVERGRAAFAGAGRVRPPEDPVLAELLVSARREVEAARALGASEDPERLGRRQEHLRAARRLQEDARRRAWQHEGEASTPVAATERGLRTALAEAGSGAVVADLVRDGDDVLAVRVSAEGSRLVRLGSWSVVGERVRRARADLGVLSNVLIPVPMRQAAVASLSRTLEALDEQLVSPLEVDGDLHVAARDVLLAVPWACLPSRHRRRTWANSWIDLRHAEPVRRTDQALVVAGPGLRFSAAEARLVGGVWDGAQVLTGEQATCAAVTAGIAPAGVLHLAAHGTHDTSNPLFSSLRLADGPLFAHELDGIDLRGVVVVLSACEVGLSTPRIGGESLGLTSVLLRLGARAVIASVAPLRDDVAARVMPALHAELRDGVMPGTALARAVADEPEPVPLVCFGPLVL
ncbi:CHAT domain-containing protein [Cellulosimicrobium marinum]|uniref:CHAT domain-containing protein n=1 Tax=Cellulosimicrobium marinum TaxID=1638992 RepID=UPI001E2F3489|nr:CHAT domain-containing protein [Cellulosimicrobium marinum]MCB7136789.1 CHAT domain-containing protein [Cellulosimicrobium marinum]